LFPEEKYDLLWLTMQNNVGIDSKEEAKIGTPPPSSSSSSSSSSSTTTTTTTTTTTKPPFLSHGLP
jgi:hypothetical protein